MIRILILCTGNSARSQMAEALLTAKGKGRIHAESAGSRPAPRVNPLAVQALAELGIDWQGRVPRSVAGLEQQRWDIVITVCDNAREACPWFPAQPIMAHWGMPDPAAAVGSDEGKLAVFRETRDVLAARIDRLLELPLEVEDEVTLRDEIEEIGR
jgi:arsenate reductase